MAHAAGVLTPLVTRAAAALIFSIRIVCVVPDLNAPQALRIEERR